MTLYDTIAGVFTLAAFFAYLNNRLVRLPTTTAIMAGALATSLVIILLAKLGYHDYSSRLIFVMNHLDFRAVLMQGMLSFLLFAGALRIELNHLKACKWEIATLALPGTIISTFLIAILVYYLLPYLNIELPWLYCLFFGALISPTDPIAVMALFKQLGAPMKLDITVTGESLFNDGVGIVIFITLYQLAFSGEAVTLKNVSLLFLRETVGGIAYGVALGALGQYLLKTTTNIKVAILVTLAMTTAGYSLANMLHVSGPIAMVVAGILVGNRCPILTSYESSLGNFWEVIDELLNVILFMLIGFEILVLEHQFPHLIAGLLSIPIVLCVRYFTVSVPIIWFMLKGKKYPRFYRAILVWGGLRGGLAVALALSLPASTYRNLILMMTYAVVTFAIIVQGLSIRPLIKKATAA